MTTQPLTITEFLLARIDEDEAAARNATAPPWVGGIRRAGEPGRWIGVEAQCVLADRTAFGIEEYEDVADSQSISDVDHIVRHDPARVLAECKAKRLLLDLSEHGCGDDYQRVQYALALPYADHPDYRAKWAV